MTAPTLSITETQICTVLRAWLLTLFPTLDIIRGQANRVAEPATPDYLIFTPTLRSRLATNSDTWEAIADPTTLSVLTATQVTVQVDVHGPNSGDNTQILAALFRDENATDAFAASGVDVQPLYASEPIQQPFNNAEDQYEERWTVDLVMQANPVVAVSQDFASTLTPTLEVVD